MSINLKNDFVYKVSDKAGHARLTTSSNVAVATALDVSTRELILQACISNTSAARVNFGAACTSTNGIQLPQAISTVALTDNATATFRIGLASVTLVNIYTGVNAEAVDMIWRN